MKVLMFGWEFPPFIAGGLGRVCQSLTRHLAERAEILFVMPKSFGHSRREGRFELRGADEIDLAVPVTRLTHGMSQKTVSFMEVNALLEPYWNETAYDYQLRSLTEFQRLIKLSNSEVTQGHLEFHGGYGADLLKEVSRYAVIGHSLGLKERFDVIHAHDWMTFLAAVEAKRASGKPMVCHIHATEFDRTGDNPNQHVYDIERYGMTAADRVIAVSHRTRDHVIQRYGIAPDKVTVVHNAVDKEMQFARGEIKRQLKEKIVLFLGRVTLQKGPDYFVEAARLVLDKRDDVRFVMAGSGDMLYRLIERVAACRMQKNFHFTGFLFGQEVEEMFAISDLYIMPSVSEPFGVTPFEAMLYQVPIIISKQSGIAEVLNHAVKVDFWDVHKLAKSITDILGDDGLSARLVAEGARELEKVSWDTAANKVFSVYREMTR